MKEGETHTVLHTSGNIEKVDNLKKLYKNDPYKARVLFMNDSQGYEENRVIVYENINGDFDIVTYTRKFGISKTNRIYSSERRQSTVKYKGGKFYLIVNYNGSRIVTATIQSIQNNTLYQGEIIKYLTKKFTWIRFLEENDILTNTAFNSIIKNKIYSFKKALRYEYNMPAPPALLIHSEPKYRNNHKALDCIKHYVEYLDNIESLKKSWMGDNFSLFYDTLKMAKTTNNKINCSWSDKRLKVEHDKWAEIITDVIFIDGDRPLIIKDVYKEFQEFSGYKMLTTTKEMAIEGKRQGHCVVSYISKVDNGICGIYHIDGYTLEIGRTITSKNSLKYDITQLRGIGNSHPQKELVEKVKEVIIGFNKIIDEEDTIHVNSSMNTISLSEINEDLPF